MGNLLVVILISDQTIPNVLFLKWILTKYPKDRIRFLFVSTEKMEQQHKSDFICNTFEDHSIFEHKRLVIVKENDFQDISQKLIHEADDLAFTEIVVNITGGTKIMSLAVFQFFQQKQHTKIYYQPIGQSLLEITSPGSSTALSSRLTIAEYLTAYGIHYRTDSTFVKSQEYTLEVYKKIEGNSAVIETLRKLQNTNYFNKKKVLDITQVQLERFRIDTDPRDYSNDALEDRRRAICTLLETFDCNPVSVSRNEMKYITGGWFEEFVYYTIKQDLKDRIQDITINTIITKNQTSNELDVIYLDNTMTIHIVECKSYINTDSSLLLDTIYKLQALRSNFGLLVKLHLYTMDHIQTESALTRAKSFGIEIHDRTVLLKENS